VRRRRSSGSQREPGIFSANAPMAGYPKVYNIETDPHEHLVVGGLLVGHLARRSTRTEHHAVRWRLRRRLLALSGHGETAVKSPLLEGKADIGQPLPHGSTWRR
jgi:hypothetical protein